MGPFLHNHHSTYHIQKADVGTIHRLHPDVTSFTSTRVCVCVFSSTPFSQFITCADSREPKTVHENHLPYPFLDTATAPLPIFFEDKRNAEELSGH